MTEHIKGIGRNYTLKTLMNKIRTKNNNYKLIDLLSIDYSTGRNKVYWKCKICNNRHIAMKLHQLYTGCSNCNNKKASIYRNIDTTKSNSQYLSELKKANPTLIPTEKYISTNHKIKHRCIKCNIERYYTPFILLRGKTGCYVCGKMKAVRSRYKRKTVKLGNRVVELQGFEPFALKQLLKTISKNSISVSGDKNIPFIPYKYNNKVRYHYPDFYIKECNTIIEVKSEYTFGLSNMDIEKISIIKSKQDAAIELGYKYIIMIIKRNGTLLGIS